MNNSEKAEMVKSIEFNLSLGGLSEKQIELRKRKILDLYDEIEVKEIFEIVSVNGELIGKNKTHNLHICNLEPTDYKIINKTMIAS